MPRTPFSVVKTSTMSVDYTPPPAEAAPVMREHRIAELALAVAHDQYPRPKRPAKKAIWQTGDDGDAVGAVEQAIRDRLIGRVAQFLEDLAGNEQPAFLARLRVCGDGKDE
jgi:hypothetical protein